MERLNIKNVRFRIGAQDLNLEVTLLNLEGKKLAIGDNDHSSYVFLTPKKPLQSGIYLLYLTNRQNGKSASMKVYRK